MKKKSENMNALNTNAEGIVINTNVGFEGMRKAGLLAAQTLDMITEHVVPGVTTNELDALCHDFAIKNNAIPAPLNYGGSHDRVPFPKSICTSINHVVCHGIPCEKKLINGDIINIDVTVIVDGWHGDTSRMFFVGDKISVMAKRLVTTTYDCMMAGIDQVKPGAPLRNVGKAIQEMAEKERFGVVRDFCGHGLGTVFHTAPSVVHYDDPYTTTILEPGMFFTIEPMINVGTWKTRMLDDGWTAVTKDRKLSAQFEHSLAVTEDGFEIFTTSPKGWLKPPYD
jgi:methionyl aminopeptidase